MVTCCVVSSMREIHGGLAESALMLVVVDKTRLANVRQVLVQGLPLRTRWAVRQLRHI